MNSVLSTRELSENDIELLLQYWFASEHTFLHGMGVDIQKMPTKEIFKETLVEQLSTPLDKKKSYCIIWMVNGVAIGHSNINQIIFGEEAFMHLHIWTASERKSGNGTALVKMTLPYFFEKLKLKKIFCEPSALNPSPNKTLEKVGFELVKKYKTTPGAICYEQEVNRWVLTEERWLRLRSATDWVW